MNIRFVFQLKIDSQQFFPFSWKLKEIRIRVFINYLEIGFLYVYTFILHPFWSFDGRDSFINATQPTPFVRTASIESLHLSYSFLLSLSESLFVFRKPDLAQDCPIFLIPGFLWIWKLSLGRFPYQGSIQLSP